MEATRREYNELNESYDSLLSEAHKFDHGTREMVEALQRANIVAPLSGAPGVGLGLSAPGSFHAPPQDG
jgi:hypothetical protein